VRVTTAFNRLLDLPGVWVRQVSFEPGRVAVTVALKRRRLHCPKCSYSTPNRESLQQRDSVWRHVDLGSRGRLEIRARLRRLRCPEHGALVEGVPFARYGARFTRDFEDTVAWLATKTDKTTITRLVRIDWETVGRIIGRVGEELLPADRLNNLFEISLDEVAWRQGHKYLTLAGDHREGCVVWGTEGKGQAAADEFFDELNPEIAAPPPPEPPAHPGRSSWQPAAAIMVPFGPCPTVAVGEGIHGAWLAAGEELDPRLFARASRLSAVSMDMTGGYAASVRANAPQAEIVIDNYHVVALATKALDEVRRERWNELRALDPTAAKQFKDARWSLLKNPEDLTERQAGTLAALTASGGKLARAWALKEMVREIFKPGLTVAAVEKLIDRLLSRLSRSRLQPFVRLGRTIRKHRQGILAARRLRLSNARAESLNNKVKLIVRRAYGFHSARAALALILLACGPITLTLSHERLT